MTPAVGAGVVMGAVGALALARGKVAVSAPKAWLWLFLDGGVVVALGTMAADARVSTKICARGM
jgi:hypothetical protein